MQQNFNADNFGILEQVVDLKASHGFLRSGDDYSHLTDLERTFFLYLERFSRELEGNHSLRLELFFWILTEWDRGQNIVA